MTRFALLLLLAAPAAAQPVPEVEAVLDAALAEQRVFLTCSALDPRGHEITRDFWLDMAAETAAALQAEGYDAASVDRFRERAAYDALMPPDGASFAEVRDGCWDDADWQVRMMNLDLIILPGAALDVLGP